MVKDRKPSAHAVRNLTHILGIDLVVFQSADHIGPHGGIIHQTDKGGPELTVCNVLRNISGHAAVNLLHPPGVAACGNINSLRIALDVHEDGT